MAYSVIGIIFKPFTYINSFDFLHNLIISCSISILYMRN